MTKIVSVAGIAIGLAGFAFIGRTLFSHWAEVKESYSTLQAANLLGSVALGLAALLVIGSQWTALLAGKGHHAPWRKGMAWYFSGNLGKYVPGGIWAIVGRAEMAVRGGIPRGDAYTATALSMATTYLGSAVAICIGSIAAWTYPVVGVLGALGLSIGFILFSNKPLRVFTLKLASKVTKRDFTMIHPRQLLVLTFSHVPAWILISLSTSVTASAFGLQIGLLQMLFISSVSWLAGFVVVGVPGGIGVREAVFTALCTSVVGAPVALSLAIASRVVFITVDLLGTLVSHLFARRQ